MQKDVQQASPFPAMNDRMRKVPRSVSKGQRSTQPARWSIPKVPLQSYRDKRFEGADCWKKGLFLEPPQFVRKHD
jgi:hypothetical protein